MGYFSFLCLNSCSQFKIAYFIQVKSASRDTYNHQQPSTGSDKWTQRELDDFISKNDWGSVAKYIAEMRNNKSKGNLRSQPSTREIRERIEHNRRQATDGHPRKKFGAKSQMQHDDISEESSRESESLWRSLSSNSYGSSNGESSYDERPSHIKKAPRRHMA